MRKWSFFCCICLYLMTWYSEYISIDMFRHNSLHIACEECITCGILSFDGLYVCRWLIYVCGWNRKKMVWMERILKVSSKEILRLLFLFARIRIMPLLNLHPKKINYKTWSFVYFQFFSWLQAPSQVGANRGSEKRHLTPNHKCT